MHEQPGTCDKPVHASCPRPASSRPQAAHHPPQSFLKCRLDLPGMNFRSKTFIAANRRERAQRQCPDAFSPEASLLRVALEESPREEPSREAARSTHFAPDVSSCVHLQESRRRRRCAGQWREEANRLLTMSRLSHRTPPQRDCTATARDCDLRCS